MVAADTMNLAYTSSICYLNFLTSMSIPKHNPKYNVHYEHLLPIHWVIGEQV